jgi:hypothetical protein
MGRSLSEGQRWLSIENYAVNPATREKARQYLVTLGIAPRISSGKANK